MGKNETSADRSNNLILGDIKTSLDYVKRLTFEKGKEIMSQHFEHYISLSIEGVGMHYFTKEVVEIYYNNKESYTIVDQNLSIQRSNSYFVDISLKNAASTHHDMNMLLKALKRKDILRLYATFFQYWWLFQTI